MEMEEQTFTGLKASEVSYMTAADIFKTIVDMAESPVVVCDLEYMIIYANPVAEKNYRSSTEALRNIKQLTGNRLDLFFSEEEMSGIRMTVEWFKDDPKNNRIFASHDPHSNSDLYILAIRNKEQELVGFFGRLEARNPETAKEFDID